MKNKFPSFLLGVLSASLIGSLTISALAASGRLTIEVDPINIQVNGQVFQPTDANGKGVPVFAYNGTTYAPLRALAEAYGLDVWYDSSSNLAAVGPKGSAPASSQASAQPNPASEDYIFAMGDTDIAKAINDGKDTFTNVTSNLSKK